MYSIFREDLHREGSKQLALLESHRRGGIVGEELADIRLQKARDVIAYVRQGSPFYRERLAGTDASLGGRSLKEVIGALPFTTKKDLSDAGMSLCAAPLSDAWVYYETTGTTGPSTPCPRNETDSLVNNTFLTLQYRDIFGAGRRVVGVMGPSELHSTGDTFEDVLRSLGHTVVKMWPRSPVVGMDRVLRLISDLNISALICTPAVAAELLKHGRRKGLDPRRLGVEIILVVGELISRSRLANLGRNWGARMYNCMYASQESSILAACGEDGFLRTNPLDVYYELICPFTGADVQVGPDPSDGELVITHLYRGQKPLLRYRTGDMVRCRADLYESWAIEPVGRVKDVLVLDDERVHAFDLESAIFEVLDQCFEYSIEIDRGSEGDALRLTLEACDELGEPARIDRLRGALQARFGVAVQIEIGDAGKLVGTAAMVSWKAARIHDRRPSADNRERLASIDIMKGR